MFNLSKKFAIAASFVAIYSGQFAAYGSETLDEAGNMKRQLVVAESAVADPTACDPLTLIPRDVMKLILEMASAETNPGHLASVNSKWRNIIRENAQIQPNLTLETANAFMKTCMQILQYNEVIRRFSKAILRYTDPDTQAVQNLNFSNLADPFKGTFDLSACGGRSQYLVITTDIKRFFTVRGENENKVVIMISPRHLVEQAIFSQEHPFASLVTDWNAAQAPVGIFWRWGNEQNLTRFDYLTTLSLKGISEGNLFENWKKAHGHGRAAEWRYGVGRYSPRARGVYVMMSTGMFVL